MDGVLLIDKPAGISSAEVVRRIKARVRPSKVGHLGTLDPFATGLLPILIGEATKIASFLEGGPKEYVGKIRLGIETDTLDPDGAVNNQAAIPRLDQASLKKAAANFIGEQQQVPPIFSAIKQGGVPLYRLARKGAAETPPPRQITISELELHPAAEDLIAFRVVCSPGTYVRSLARDIARHLGTVAILAELRRTKSSGFEIESACSLEETLHALETGGVVDIVGIRRALIALTEVQVSDEIARRIRNGDWAALELADVPNGEFKAVKDGELLAIARKIGGETRLLRVFNRSDGH